jgi:hypothetical protein
MRNYMYYHDRLAFQRNAVLSFNMVKPLTGARRTKKKKEARKCVVLYANCHREIHAGMHKYLINNYNALEGGAGVGVDGVRLCPWVASALANLE